MLALVTGLFLPALFIASGGFAAGVIGRMWRRHGGAFWHLRAMIAACDAAPAMIVGLAVQDLRELSPSPAARRLARPVRQVALGSNPCALRAAA